MIFLVLLLPVMMNFQPRHTTPCCFRQVTGLAACSGVVAGGLVRLHTGRVHRSLGNIESGGPWVGIQKYMGLT